MLWQLWQNKNISINQRYPASTTHTAHFAKLFNFFVVKSELLIPNDLTITLMLKFMKSNKFYYFQAVKVADSKEVGD